MLNQALYSSKNMCWCTPQDLYDQLNDEFHFVLDVAATSKSAKCDMYYTPEDDGLSQTWNRGGECLLQSTIRSQYQGLGFQSLLRKYTKSRNHNRIANSSEN